MGKESEIWDDSALIKAFDDAISKFKKMHNITHYTSQTQQQQQQKRQQQQQEEEKLTEADPVPTLSPEKGEMEVSDNANDLSNGTTCESSDNWGSINGVSTPKSNQFVGNFSASEPNLIQSTGGHTEYATLEGQTELQSVEYNQLLSQYYEIEEQRQKLLQQLQASSSNYQTLTENVGPCAWNRWYPDQVPYCQLCSYNCFAAPCPSIPCNTVYQCYGGNVGSASAEACKVEPMKPPLSSCPSIPGCNTVYQCYGGPTSAEACKVEHLKLPVSRDESIIQAAKEAVEKAVSSTKLRTSVASNIFEEKSTKGEEILESTDNGITQNTGVHPELSDVLNAWFSAGFYTGKYVSRQALAKNQL